MTRGLLLCCALAWALFACAGAEQDVLAGIAPVPGAPDVLGVEDLLDYDRFWPYHVALSGSWKPEGEPQALPADARGVLIRVEPGGIARIDFGRDGLHYVPVPQTDLLERANLLRRAQLEKSAPNFVLAIGPRLLLSAEGGPPQAFHLERALGYARFLCVFADPQSAQFEVLSRELAALQTRSDLLTIVFPQGPQQADPRVASRLRDLDWHVPFVYAHLSQLYTRTLVREEVGFPHLALYSAEGRVLREGSWNAAGDDMLAQLLAELPEG